MTTIFKFERMIGKVMKSVVNDKNEELIFEDVDGNKYTFYHEQDCCETVQIEDIVGDLDDLVGSPILMAEAVSDSEYISSQSVRAESCTWTFFKFATVKGYVTVRWFGESNGYYSETVDYTEIDKNNYEVDRVSGLDSSCVEHYVNG